MRGIPAVARHACALPIQQRQRVVPPVARHAVARHACAPPIQQRQRVGRRVIRAWYWVLVARHACTPPYYTPTHMVLLRLVQLHLRLRLLLLCLVQLHLRLRLLLLCLVDVNLLCLCRCRCRCRVPSACSTCSTYGQTTRRCQRGAGEWSGQHAHAVCLVAAVFKKKRQK